MLSYFKIAFTPLLFCSRALSAVLSGWVALDSQAPEVQDHVHPRHGQPLVAMSWQTSLGSVCHWVGPHLMGMAPRTGAVVGDQGREPCRPPLLSGLCDPGLGQLWVSRRERSMPGTHLGLPLPLGPYLLSLRTMTTRFLQSDSSLTQDYVHSEPVSAWGREPNVKAFVASGRAQQG